MRLNRREFLQTSAKTTLGMSIGAGAMDALTSSARAQKKDLSPNEKVIVGVIGVGGMGTVNMRNFMKHPEVEVAAVCDVHSKRLADAATQVEKKYGKKPLVDKDFRRIMERKDIDAVIISTPDHWHALPFIYACETGKDVFCEKPISHNILEGRSMVGAAQRYQRVTQVNLVQRGMGQFQDAVDYVSSGKMGRVYICRAWRSGGIWCLGKNPIKEPPAELDWDFWCGPARLLPYHDKIDPSDWRLNFEWGTGMTGDWGVHMMDIILWGMNDHHPLEVTSLGDKLRCDPEDDRKTPDTHMAVYRFSTFMMTWEVRPDNRGFDGGRDHGAEFIGEAGTLIVDRNGIIWNGDGKGPERKSPDVDLIADFLSNVKTRGKCRVDIKSAYYATVLCHLANLSYQCRKTIKWDGIRGLVLNDKAAMNYLAYRREYRKPWTLPMYEMT
ncbi:MAG: Gfo/Idh/MocA family protein [Armatimonadota bacterium]